MTIPRSHDTGLRTPQPPDHDARTAFWQALTDTLTNETIKAETALLATLTMTAWQNTTRGTTP